MGGERKRMSRAKGCTLGCLGVLFLMSVGVVVFFTLIIDPLFGEFAGEIREGVATQYAAAKAEDRVPDDRIPLFDELAAMVEDGKVSAWSAGLIAAVVIDPLADGEITDEEASGAVTVREFVKAHPGLDFSGFVRFLVEHPDLMERVQKLNSVLGRRAASADEVEQFA